MAYSGLAFLQKGIGFFLLPVYTAYLSPSDYGVVAVITSIVGFLAMIYPLGADASATREYFADGEKEAREVPTIWGSLLLSMVLFSGIVTLLLWITHAWFLDRFLGTVAFWPYMVLGLVLALFSPIRTFYGSCLQVQEHALQYLRMEGGAIALRLMLILGFIIYFEWNAFGILLASAITEGLFALVSLFLLRKSVQWRLDFAVLRKTSSYALPMVPYNLANWATTYLAGIILNVYHGTREAGLYSLAANFSMILTFFVGGFHQAYYPPVYKALASGGGSLLAPLRWKATAAVALFAVMGFGLSCFGREVLTFMARPAFISAAALIAPLALAALFQGVYVFYSLTLSYHRPDAKLLPIVAVAGAVASIGSMLFLVPRYSMMGAAWAGTIGVFIRLTVAVIFARGRLANIWPHLDFLLLTVIAAAGCLICSIYFSSELSFSWMTFLIKLGGLIAFTMMCALIVLKARPRVS